MGLESDMRQARFSARMERKARDMDFAERFGKSETDTKQLLEQLMLSIDFESTMARLGVAGLRKTGEHVWCGMCPDHVKYKGVQPSDPKWYINDETGLTFCQTEGRGSSIISVARNVWGLSSAQEAFDALMNGYELAVHVPKAFRTQEETKADKEDENARRLKESLDGIFPIIKNASLPDKCKEYFAKDGIGEQTLRDYGVSFCDAGYYRDRAILPFLDEASELCGFIAIDTLGRDLWSRVMAQKHSRMDDSTPLDMLQAEYRKNYRKTLYARGFLGRNHFYGLFEDEHFLSKPVEELMLVEGERDCLKMKQEGIPCLSVHGTFLKPEQVQLLNRLGITASLKRLYLGFDMDAAGDKACESVFGIMSQYMDWDRIYVLEFPEDETGAKRDPKKFSHDEMRGVFEDAIKNRRRRRENVKR